ADTASSLLELVQAMSAVSRMQLGSLVGKDYAKVLRELDAALGRHEEVRVELGAKIRPLYERVSKELQEGLNQSNPVKLRGLEQVALQLTRISEDAAHSPMLYYALGSLKTTESDAPTALEYYRQALLLFIAALPDVDADGLYRCATFYAQTLREVGLLDDGLAVSRAVYELSGGSALAGKERHRMLLVAGYNDVLKGNLAKGMADMHLAYHQLPSEHQLYTRGWMLHASLLAGDVSLDEAATRALSGRGADKVVVIRHAAFCEDADTISRLLDSLSPTDTPWGFALAEREWTRQYAECLGKPRKDFVDMERDRSRVLLSKPPERFTAVAQFNALVRIAAMARAAKRPDVAMDACMKAHTIAEKLPQGIALTVEQRAFYARNVLSLSRMEKAKRAMVEHAMEFVRNAMSNGYGFVAGLQGRTAKS
ncbi:MAG: hypothetical protein L6Q71_10640, partial [Planctomycetes bacterium]|nr:hypothetical protein [Planctomycetota bacterium]